MLVAARAVHFGSVMLLFGGIVFALAVARPALRAVGGTRSALDDALDRKLLRIGFWSLAASIISGAVWLGAEAQLMSGLSIEQALGADTLALVLGKTAFGRLWLLRFALAIGLGALLVASARSDAKSRRVRFIIAALPIAAAYLLSLAWAGHAAAAQGDDRWLQIASDAAHLVAAGAWLGA